MGWTTTRAKLAGLHHAQIPDPALVDSLRRQLKTEKAELYLTGITQAGVILHPEQLRHLAGILLAAAGGDGDGAT